MSSYTQPTKLQIKLERLPETLKRNGKSKSQHYLDMKLGLWPKPISLGARAVAYPSYETTAIIQAMIAGQSPEQIKELVKNLVAQRKELMGDLI